MNLIIQHYFWNNIFILSHRPAAISSLWCKQLPAWVFYAGFYELANSGREVYSMNPGMAIPQRNRYRCGKPPTLMTRDWKVVSLPDGIEYVPTEASGCINYQRWVWYRKHFTRQMNWKAKTFPAFRSYHGKNKVFCKRQFIDRTLWRIPACSHWCHRCTGWGQTMW